ncbi:MAG: alpha/beta fold hydrolase [Spirochaetota bacterium]
MITGYSTLSNMRVPYVVLGDATPEILVIPGIEPEHRVPEGLRLQGVRGAFEELAEKRTVAVAWRADRPASELTLATMASDYVDLVRELELTDVAIVGISTGCPMAIETAARLGRRCSRLALVAGGAYLSQEGQSLLRRSATLAEQGRWRELARDQIAAFYPNVFGRLVLASIAWLFPGLYGEPDDSDYFVAITSAVVDADLRSRAEDVSARALVVNGERDLLYPPAIARETALLLTDADVVTIPRAGHGAFKSHARRINRLLEGFLDPASAER